MQFFSPSLICHVRKVKLAWTCGNRLYGFWALHFLPLGIYSVLFFWTRFVWQVKKKITRPGGERGRFFKDRSTKEAAIWVLKLGWKAHSLWLYLNHNLKFKQGGFDLNQEAAIKFIFLRNVLLVYNIACSSQLTWRKEYISLFTVNLFHFIEYISF